MHVIPWRTGVNMREFAYYGTSFLQHTTPELQRLQLDSLSNLRVKLVRFFASHRDFSTNDCITRVRSALDILNEAGMQAIVCLDDGLGISGYFVRGTEPYHNQTQGHLHSDYWVQEKYRDHYLPHIRAIAEALGEHPALLIWELGNEYALHPREPRRDHSLAFLKFARVASEVLKQAAPRKLVSTGLVNSRQVASLLDDDLSDFSRRLYGLDTIDAISIHYYQHDGEKQYAGTDIETARTLGKPFYIGEFGADRGIADRANYYRDEIQAWQDAGAFTVLPWAYDSSNMDVGVSDLYAFARIHEDFGAICGIVVSFSVDATPWRMEETAVAERREPSAVTSPVEPTPVPVQDTMLRHPVMVAQAATTVAAPITPSFVLQYPMTWAFTVKSKFNDPANYGGNFVQKREGILFVPQGTPASLEVRAAQRGVVQKVTFYQAGYGHYVCVEHAWYGQIYITWYGHLERATVKVGDYVNAGDVIGIAGKSGSASELSLFLTVQHKDRGLKGYVVPDVIDPQPLLIQNLPARDEVWWDADVTVEDRTLMRPGQFFKKTWRVRNAGNTTWDKGYQLTFYSGNPLGANNSIPVPVTKPGELVLLSVDMVAPQENGEHTSNWMMKNPQGQFFHHNLYTIINVQSKDQVVKPSLSRFVRDVTIPDGTRLKPGTSFVKTWRIRNSGQTTWGSGYVLAHFKDERMGAPESVPLPAIAPNREGEVSVTLTAPQNSGRYRSTWKPRDPNGNSFDFELYTEIVVDANIGESGGTPNEQPQFSSPVEGNYKIGWRFMDPVPYLDGKHKGVDYVSNVGIGLPVIARGKGIVHFARQAKAFSAEKPNFISHNLSGDALNQAFSNLDPWHYGFGNLVIIRMEWNDLPVGGRSALTAQGGTNYFTYVFYAHLHDIFVKEGDIVTPNTQIATLGNSGNSTGPHLHLEIRAHKSPVNPGVIRKPEILINPVAMFSE